MNTIQRDYATSLMNRIVDIVPSKAGELVNKFYAVVETVEAWDAFIEELQNELQWFEATTAEDKAVKAWREAVKAGIPEDIKATRKALEAAREVVHKLLPLF